MKLLSSKKSQNKEFGFDLLPGRPIICAGRDAKIFSRRQMLTNEGSKACLTSYESAQKKESK